MIRVFSFDKEWYVLSLIIVNFEIFLIIVMVNFEYFFCIVIDMFFFGGEVMLKFGRFVKYGVRK